MKFKNTFRKIFFLAFFCLFFSHNSNSQCFQIESILVDACDGDTNTEGLNEMVRFKVGNTAINTNNLSVNWPSNSWGGLIQNATTNSKVVALNASIISAGGCGQILQPTGGVLPANATVILVTSYNFEPASNSFGALTDTIYILFQNSNTINGHFANYGTSANRTLTMNFGSCSDSVTYNRSLLIDQNGQNIAADGATVNFTPSGVATYVNNGCVAPVQPFTIDAGSPSQTVCVGSSVNLNGSGQGYQSVNWFSPSGTFSNPNTISTIFTPNAASAGSTVIVTLTATNSCGTQISDSISILVNNGITPSFNTTPVTICPGGTVPALALTSPNGISGTWNPSFISNSISGTYTFTPNAGQCATSVSLSVTVSNSVTPNFDSTPLVICSGSAVPILNNISPNGITGSWNPLAINNTISGTYIFTPNSGQCASSVTLNVTVTTSVIPNFDVTPQIICAGSQPMILNTTSPNGIVGSWNPSAINNTVSGTYIFTPNSGQCASAVSLNVTITTNIVPDFDITPLVLCENSIVPTLSNTSPNGISGIWNPAVIDNLNPGSYTFTPNAGQCASSVILNVSIENLNATIKDNCINKELILEVIPVANSYNPNDVNYVWENSNGVEVGTNAATFNVSDYLSGITNPVFPITFKATILGNCQTTATATVYSISCNIPKGISPNGDGKNDEFDLTGLNVKNLTIFNRYGLKIYSQKNYVKEWHGQSNNGDQMPDGTYFYVIDREGIETTTGWVYINGQH